MKFRAYCIVVIGDTMGILDEIRKVSETEPNRIDGKGLFIGTFISASSPDILTEFFKADKRNFMMFELNTDTAGFNITKPEMQEGLFGFLKTFRREELDNMTERLLHDIKMTSETATNRSEWKAPASKVRGAVKTKSKPITESEINEMSKKEKEILFNKLLDKGFENYTKEDKKIMEILVKKSS